MRRFILLPLLLFGATLAGAPCNGTLTVTRTERGTARLHYEDAYPGYSPIFGVPVVTNVSKGFDPNNLDGTRIITIIQPVADIADSSKAASGSPLTICHAEELDIGTPEDGYNEIDWVDQVTVNGADAGSRNSAPAFRWLDGVVLCSTVPQVITPTPALEGAPINLTLNWLWSGQPMAMKTTVNGSTVTVDLSGASCACPLPPSPPLCSPFTTRLQPLPAGEYQLLWRFPTQVIATTSFTVAKPARTRAARH